MLWLLVAIISLLGATSLPAWSNNTSMGRETTLIIPRPKVCRVLAGSFSLSGQTRIAAASDKARIEAEKLAKWMRAGLGLSPRFADSAGSNVIEVELVKSLPGVPVREPDEGYSISVSPDRVRISARTDRGLFYGIQSLRDLTRASSRGARIPACRIDDWPDFPYRGLLLTIGQRFTSTDTLEDRVDQMARAKLNKLHLLLAGTTVFAARISSYPDVVGSTKDRNLCYTKEQLRALVVYAAERKVEIIPQVSIPGHATHILETLPELRCRVPKPSTWTMCAGTEDTYRFIERVVDEVAPIFPSPIFHIGTDEIEFTDNPERGITLSWRECPVCQARMKQEGIKGILSPSKDAQAMFYYFVRRVNSILAKHGKRTMMWNDQLDIGKPEELNVPKDTLVHFWRIAAPGRGPVENCTYEGFLDKGFDVVNSYYPETYVNRHLNEEHALRWNPLSSPKCPDEHRAQVLGGEICAWSNHDFYPRVLPSVMPLFGDRMWNARPIVDRDSFARAMTTHIFGPFTPSSGPFAKLADLVLPFGLCPDLTAYKPKPRSSPLPDSNAFDTLLLAIDREAKSGRLEDPATLAAYRESVQWLRDQPAGTDSH
jgi:N-acetyl-beta-hexosaminidase